MKKAFVASTLVLLLASASFVQHAEAQQASGGAAASARPPSEQVRKFYDAVAKDNQAEIQISRYGAEKAQSPAVKAFARVVGTDHEEFQDKLTKMMPPRTASHTRSRPHAHKRTHHAHRHAHARPHAHARVTAAPPAAPAQASAAPVQTQAPKNADAQKRNSPQVDETLAKLRDKSGADFDNAFVQAHIDNHDRDFIQKFDKEANSGDNENLRLLAKQGSDLCKQHLELARTVKDTIGKP